MSTPDRTNSDFQRVVVLSGPSGSGKTTIVNRLTQDSPVKLLKSVSATTRKPRPQEIHGEDYYFLSDEDFRQGLADDLFIEHAEVFSSGLPGQLRLRLRNTHAQLPESRNLPVRFHTERR